MANTMFSMFFLLFSLLIQGTLANSPVECIHCSFNLWQGSNVSIPCITDPESMEDRVLCTSGLCSTTRTFAPGSDKISVISRSCATGSPEKCDLESCIELCGTDNCNNQPYPESKVLEDIDDYNDAMVIGADGPAIKCYQCNYNGNPADEIGLACLRLLTSVSHEEDYHTACDISTRECLVIALRNPAIDGVRQDPYNFNRGCYPRGHLSTGCSMDAVGRETCVSACNHRDFCNNGTGDPVVPTSAMSNIASPLLILTGLIVIVFTILRDDILAIS